MLWKSALLLPCKLALLALSFLLLPCSWNTPYSYLFSRSTIALNLALICGDFSVLILHQAAGQNDPGFWAIWLQDFLDEMVAELALGEGGVVGGEIFMIASRLRVGVCVSCVCAPTRRRVRRSSEWFWSSFCSLIRFEWCKEWLGVNKSSLGTTW